MLLLVGEWSLVASKLHSYLLTPWWSVHQSGATRSCSHLWAVPGQMCCRWPWALGHSAAPFSTTSTTQVTCLHVNSLQVAVGVESYT